MSSRTQESATPWQVPGAHAAARLAVPILNRLQQQHAAVCAAGRKRTAVAEGSLVYTTQKATLRLAPHAAAEHCLGCGF